MAESSSKQFESSRPAQLLSPSTCSEVGSTPKDTTPQSPLGMPTFTPQSSMHPLPIGTKVPCRPRTMEGSYRPAEITRYRMVEGEHQYYVHFVDQDKRLDDWISVDRLDLSRVKLKKGAKAPNDGKFDKPGAKGKGQKGKKRKVDGIEIDGKGKLSKLSPDGEIRCPHDDPTKTKNIRNLYFGKYSMETWYYSPFHYSIERFPNAMEAKFDIDADPPPIPEVSNFPCGADANLEQIDLYMCEFCLKPLESRQQLVERHLPKCRIRHPPGDEVYRDDEARLSIFEVDGKRERCYCQNLAMLSKLFLEHKWLKFNIEPFLFYVMTRFDQYGHHFMGYFSKEKGSSDGQNLACIMTLPPFQKQGIGRLLIEFSYELTKKEGKTGSPEKPLSDLGEKSYQSFWRETLLQTLALEEAAGRLRTADDLSKLTGIAEDDVVATLTALGLIQGKSKVPVRLSDPARILYERILENKRLVHINSMKLHWVPQINNK